MMIEYCRTPGDYIGLQVNKELVAWVYPRMSDPIYFDVVDETAGPDMSDHFQTLSAADCLMWEIARRERARVRNRAAT